MAHITIDENGNKVKVGPSGCTSCGQVVENIQILEEAPKSSKSAPKESTDIAKNNEVDNDDN